MKLYALILLLYLLSPKAPSFSQDKIEGIGKFKVGKGTIALVQEVVAQTRIPLEVVDSRSRIEAMTKSQIVEIKPNPNLDKALLSPLNAPLCSHIRVFYMPKYKEADIELKSVYLFFQDEVLVKFTCYASSELNKAMELMYGQPEVTIVKLGSACDVDAKNYIITWHNEGIDATLSLLISYNRTCQKRVSQEFNIALKEKETEIERCEVAARERVKLKQENTQEKSARASY